MTTKNNTAQVAVQAKLCPNSAETPLEMHDIYMHNANCGYTRDLLLTAHESREIASRLRGISGITGVLMACNGDDIELSEFLRSGLHDALNALADDASGYLEQAATRHDDEVAA